MKQKEKKENERKKFVDAGGRIISKRLNPKSSLAPTQAKTIADVTKAGFCLPTTYSERTMVYPKSRGTDVLLQIDESGDVGDLARECNKRVRWDFSGERTFCRYYERILRKSKIKCWSETAFQYE